MCGIFGYIGRKEALSTVLNGLHNLEYRGYDSAGIVGVKDGKLLYWKEVGKLNILEKEVLDANVSLHCAIGHTRWATHGVPNKINAHPQFDTKHTLAVVHNGIIENHEELRSMLKKQNVTFVSETDTEVVAHLIASQYEGDILQAVQKAASMLRGAYALAVLHQAFPDRIVCIANQSPLVIGLGKGEVFVSSDSNAFASHANEAIFLTNSEIAVVKADKIEIFNESKEQVKKETQKIESSLEISTKNGFEHYTLKEIFQQPQTIHNAFAARILEEQGTAIFDNAHFDPNTLIGINKIIILACGTSWHAGLIGASMLEDLARIPVSVEISSEFRYKNPIILPGTQVIAISQSGETADTIAAVKEAKAKGAKILSICNVESSTLVRESDSCIFLRAGPEIGVCSTKAFTSQVVVLSLFTVLLARMRHMDKAAGIAFLDALQNIPKQIQGILNQAGNIQKIAEKYAHYKDAFFIGRRYMYPTSLEAALKLKEIAYINANGYPAGELKHGPIALLNENCLVVALCANKQTFTKMHSNLMEVKSRSAPIFAIAEEGTEGLSEITKDIIYVPQTIDELATIPTVVVLQLFAYYAAKALGADIDQPRNLAKSVTVE